MNRQLVRLKEEAALVTARAQYPDLDQSLRKWFTLPNPAYVSARKHGKQSEAPAPTVQYYALQRGGWSCRAAIGNTWNRWVVSVDMSRRRLMRRYSGPRSRFHPKSP